MSVLKTAVTQRLRGERPSSIRALLAAAVAGVAAAVTTYKLLRS